MISSNKFFSLNKSETPGVNLSSQRWIENSLFPEIFLNWIHSLHFNHVLFTCLTWLSPFSCFLTFFTYLKCYMLWIVMGTIAELGAVLPNPFDLLWSTAQRCFIRTLLSQVNAVDTLLIACDVLRDISWDFQIFQILHFQWNTRRACLSATSTFLFQSSSDGNSSQQSREPSNNSNNLSTSMFWYFGAERASEARAVKGQQTAWTVKDLWCSFVGALCGPKKNQRPFFSKSQLGAKRRERELAGKQCWNSTLACAPCMMWAGDVLATSTGNCAKLNFTQTGWTGPYSTYV